MRYSNKEIVKALSIFALGVGVATGSHYYKRDQVSIDKVEEAYQYVKKNDCYLNGWLVQNLQIESNGRSETETKSDLPIEKYNAGLNIRLIKRLITEDGKTYTDTTDHKAKYVTFDKTRFFTYTCKGDETYKTLFGFYDRTKGTPQK